MKTFETKIDKVVVISNKILDFYLDKPIQTDGIISVIIYLICTKVYYFNFKILDKSNQLNILSNLISTEVSLAGFILAALTIIVTFKSNLQMKLETQKAAIEIIFKPPHYQNIVKVFKYSIIEYILCIGTLYFFWESSDNLEIKSINTINLIAIVITLLAILRSLFILFRILQLSDKTK